MSAIWFAIGSRKGKRHFEGKCAAAEEHLSAAPRDIFTAWSPGIPASLLLSSSSVAWPSLMWASSSLSPKPPGLLQKYLAVLFLVVGLPCPGSFKPSYAHGAHDGAEESPPNHYSFKDLETLSFLM